MAFESLNTGVWIPPSALIRPESFRSGVPDIDEATGVTMEMVEYLGGVTDAAKESFQRDIEEAFST